MTINSQTGSLQAIAEALRDGSVSARALAESAIENHEAHGGKLAAYKTWDPDRLRAEAGVADDALAAGIDLGPMQGIPVFSQRPLRCAGISDICGQPT